jgi:transposase
VLERWARRPKSGQALALRCRIVLAAAGGEQSKEIAARLGCSTDTVGKWRGRFARRGLDGLHDEPRPGRPRSIGDDDIEWVIVKTLEERPLDATHWSTRSMARATGMSQTAISRIWRAFGLKLHQTEAFRLSPDPLTRCATSWGSTSTRPTPPSCSASTRSPRSSARPLGPGLAVDAWGAPAPHPRLRSPRHHQPLRGARRRLGDGDRRHLAAPSRRGVPPLPEPDRWLAAGAHRRARRARQLLHPQDAIDPALASAPPALHAPLHTAYSSWINLVERWFAELTTKWLKRSAHRSVRDLTDSIRAWTANWNEDPKPYTWHKTDEIHTSLASYCQRISDLGACHSPPGGAGSCRP